MTRLLSASEGFDDLFDGQAFPLFSEQISLLQQSPALDAPPDILHKSTAVVHMYPISGAYGHYCRRVYNALLYLALRVWNHMGPDYRGKVLSQRRVLRFSSTVGEISMVMRATSNATERIYQAVDALYKLECRFDAMAEDNSLWNVSSRLISQWARPEKGTGEIQWEYPPDVFALLMKPSRYAIVDLALSNSLSSGAALALYENCHRYVSNPGHLTARLPVENWIRLILTTRTAPNYFEPGRYRYFKRDVLTPAIAELNDSEACPIAVEVLETKGLRGKVTHLQFRVELKQRPLPTTTGQTGDPRIEAQLRSWGVADQAISRMLVSYDEEELWHNIRVFSRRLEKGGVKSPAAAFVNQLQNDYGAYRAAQAPAAAEDAAVAAPARPDPAAQHKALVAMYARHVGERARAVFAGWAQEAQDAAVQRYLADAATPAIVREQYARKGLDTRVVSIGFFLWLSKQPDVLGRPEELSLDGYRAWQLERDAQEAVAPHECVTA
ncbi:MAG TPA: replication initiation protein [Pseudorhodoferax sp.]|jgi:hypothetical protein|nr:replication initiation protein [Pseudorhodoferax sp.]